MHQLYVSPEHTLTSVREMVSERCSEKRFLIGDAELFTPEALDPNLYKGCFDTFLQTMDLKNENKVDPFSTIKGVKLSAPVFGHVHLILRVPEVDGERLSKRPKLACTSLRISDRPKLYN